MFLRLVELRIGGKADFPNESPDLGCKLRGNRVFLVNRHLDEVGQRPTARQPGRGIAAVFLVDRRLFDHVFAERQPLGHMIMCALCDEALRRLQRGLNINRAREGRPPGLLLGEPRRVIVHHFAKCFREAAETVLHQKISLVHAGAVPVVQELHQFIVGHGREFFRRLHAALHDHPTAPFNAAAIVRRLERDRGGVPC